MRKESIPFLIAGFALGFAILYFWTRERAPQIVAAMPVMGTPQQQDGSSEPPPPPLDTARVRTLQDRVKANPRDFEALVELGNIDFDQRNFSAATSWYSKALEIQPNNVNVRTDMGTTMFYSKNFDGAIEEFRKSLALEPTHAQTLFNLGVAYLHGKNDPKAALESWEKLVATNPNNPQIDFVKQQIAALKAQVGGAAATAPPQP